MPEKKSEVKKGFFARMFEAMDKKMQEQSNCATGCCCSRPKGKEKGSNGCC